MDDRHDVSALWQRETRNLIEDFAAESALADVVLLAGSRDGDAPMRTVAAGPDLVGIAQCAC